MQTIAIIGGGTWGTALAAIAARAGHTVTIWARSEDVVGSINRDHVNPRYLTDYRLPESVKATNDFAEALKGADLVVLATPSHAVRNVLTCLAPYADPKMIFVGAAKGVEIESGKRISEVVEDALGRKSSGGYVCLSGPSFAKEVVAGHPTAIVAAGTDVEHCRAVQQALSFENLRLYTNNDLVGVELGGAMKNVMAIAAGMVTGLGFGSNSTAALITRGLAEMTRLALKEGARRETMMGLAGLGDLVLTCTGSLSRNRFVGTELGKGRSLVEICAGMTEVAEGIKTTEAISRLAERRSVETPITNEVHAVLYENKTPRDAVTELMTRPLREEF